MPDRQVKLVSVDKLKPHPKNARTHSKKQIRQIADSIERFGFTNPILVDENNAVLAGHCRLAAAKLLGRRDVPTLVVSGLSEAQKRAYLLADNKLAEKAGWDRAILAVELNSLAPLLEEIGLEISLTGFEPSEIDSLMGDLVDPEVDPADEPPPLAAKPVSRAGDLWLLGPHRLLCGDAREAPHFRRLMGGDLAAMVFADPPYNVCIKSVQGRGKIKHGDFAMASGEMSKAQFTAFLAATLGLALRYSDDGSIHYVCMDWRHLEEMLAGWQPDLFRAEEPCRLEQDECRPRQLLSLTA